MALLLGVEVHTGVEFVGLTEPSGENGLFLLNDFYESIKWWRSAPGGTCNSLFFSQVGWPSCSLGLILSQPSSLMSSFLLEVAGLSLMVRQTLLLTGHTESVHGLSTYNT